MRNHPNLLITEFWPFSPFFDGDSPWIANTPKPKQGAPALPMRMPC